MELHPFRGLRPTREMCHRVASPPYDVINTAEAKAFVGDNAASFLHVTRPEINLPSDVDIHSEVVYREAARQLIRLRESRILVQDQTAALWAYRQIMAGRAQVGVIGCANVQDYEDGLIKKHEFTRPEKEDDRTHHVDTTNANAGPVFLACRTTAALQALLSDWTQGEPEFDFTGDDGVRHTLWRTDDPADLARAAQVYKSISAFYIADGHHRAASAWRVRNIRREEHPDNTGTEAWNRFLTVVFPDEQLEIMAYNRVVADLNGRTVTDFLQAVSAGFDISEPGAVAAPAEPHTFSMYLDGNWRTLSAKPHIVSGHDAVARLDVAILQDHLLEPVLGIKDPRVSERIAFVGGIRGTEELERRVQQNNGGVAFSMYPTAMSELFAVADADRVMPPKSTWFEPKLASGLLVHTLS